MKMFSDIRLDFVRSTFYEQRFYIVPFLVVWSLTLLIQAFFTQNEIILFVNQHHCTLSDEIFWWSTGVGNGICNVIVALTLILIRIRLSVYILISFLFTGLIVQVLKRTIFSDMQRPMKYLSEHWASMHKVQNIEFLSNNSFPSGHTTSAFAMFTCLAFALRPAWMKAACLVLACSVAYSRMYLLQHYLRDITAGSILGVSFVFLLRIVFHRYCILKKWDQKGLLLNR